MERRHVTPAEIIHMPREAPCTQEPEAENASTLLYRLALQTQLDDRH